MKTTGIVAAVTAVYGLVLGTIYWFVDYEVTGTILLLCLLPYGALIAVWLRLQGRHVDVPEDDPDADPAALAGEVVGTFPHDSVWPAMFAGGVAIAALGLFLGVWMIVLGALVTLYAIVNLMRESRD